MHNQSPHLTLQPLRVATVGRVARALHPVTQLPTFGHTKKGYPWIVIQVLLYTRYSTPWPHTLAVAQHNTVAAKFLTIVFKT